MVDYFTVGYIFGLKGLKGEVKIKSLTDLDRFSLGSILRIDPPVDNYLDLTVKKYSNKKKYLIVKFEEINNINDAEKIKGRYLIAKKTNLPADTYYTDDLVGLKVISNENENIGVVKEIASSKAHDILSVKGKKKLDIPVTKNFIEKIEIDKGRIIIKNYNELLEL